MSENVELKGVPRKEYSSAQYTFSIFKKDSFFSFLFSNISVCMKFRNRGGILTR